MQYTIDITINLPREKVIELFDNPDNLRHWQPGFQSFEPISGTPGEVGAKSRLRYKTGGREIELIETVTSRNLPDEFSGTYETKGIWNEIRNRFEAVNATTTQWTSHVEFKGSGFMMKVMMALMPGAFRKQSKSFMEHFKQWAEQAHS